MAGKRRTHWAQRRKKKIQRRQEWEETGETGSNEYHKYDRRAEFPEQPHPGSYAVTRPASTEKEAIDKEDRPIKRRYGLWVAFCGKNYSGMQMNEGVKTVEAELERALYEVDAIVESNYGFLQKIGWSRAARTDKGVHAASQVVTAKLHVGEDLETFTRAVNNALPDDIRVLDTVSVTKNFNARLSCDKRTYEYIAPTFMFEPRSLRPRPSSEAKEDASSTPSEAPIDTNDVQTHLNYKISDETLATLRSTLKKYEGSHNFHNFTAKVISTSSQAQRFIHSFTVGEPFEMEGIQWVKLQVVGQSFLLHHIRKMIGTAADIVAGVTDDGAIERAMGQDKIDLPMAPSVGLYLAQPHFEAYNRKVERDDQADHDPLDITLKPDIKAKMDEFKEHVIIPHIISHEKKYHSYMTWLRHLESQPFEYISRTQAKPRNPEIVDEGDEDD